MAPFARVVTYDPARNYGFSGDCTKEGFPAGDVFLETDLSADKNGVYAAPIKGGLACIGLQWMEQRRHQGSGDPVRGHRKPSRRWQVHAWSAGSGRAITSMANPTGKAAWKPFKGRIEQRGDRWTLNCAEETRKIRWIFPADKPVTVRKLTAITYSNWDQANLLFQLEQPMPGARGEIEMYNGEIVEPAGSGSPIAAPGI